VQGLGVAAAERWLGEHFEQVGKVSTLDLTHVYTPEALGGGLS
jgi:hypothetical protein